MSRICKKEQVIYENIIQKSKIMKKKLADLKKERIDIFGNNYMNDKKSFIQQEKMSI